MTTELPPEAQESLVTLALRLEAVETRIGDMITAHKSMAASLDNIGRS